VAIKLLRRKHPFSYETFWNAGPQYMVGIQTVQRQLYKWSPLWALLSTKLDNTLSCAWWTGEGLVCELFLYTTNNTQPINV